MKIKIWKSTDKRSGGYFYCLQGVGEMCVLFEEARLSIDEEFSSFGFHKDSWNKYSSYKSEIIVDTEDDLGVYSGHLNSFCMVHGLAEELIPLLDFTIKHRKEIFGEN